MPGTYLALSTFQRSLPLSITPTPCTLLPSQLCLLPDPFPEPLILQLVPFPVPLCMPPSLQHVPYIVPCTQYPTFCPTLYYALYPTSGPVPYMAPCTVNGAMYPTLWSVSYIVPFIPHCTLNRDLFKPRSRAFYFSLRLMDGYLDEMRCFLLLLFQSSVNARVRVIVI